MHTPGPGPAFDGVCHQVDDDALATTSEANPPLIICVWSAAIRRARGCMWQHRVRMHRTTPNRNAEPVGVRAFVRVGLATYKSSATLWAREKVGIRCGNLYEFWLLVGSYIANDFIVLTDLFWNFRIMESWIVILSRNSQHEDKLQTWSSLYSIRFRNPYMIRKFHNTLRHYILSTVRVCVCVYMYSI